jgi:hypothetical protein
MKGPGEKDFIPFFHAARPTLPRFVIDRWATGDEGILVTTTGRRAMGHSKFKIQGGSPIGPMPD